MLIHSHFYKRKRHPHVWRLNQQQRILVDFFSDCAVIISFIVFIAVVIFLYALNPI